jgi:hypothetical protein
LTYDAKHFDTSIGKDCSNNKFRCSFLRALIWYKILFDIICPLGRVGGRKRLCNTLYISNFVCLSCVVLRVSEVTYNHYSTLPKDLIV